MSDDDEISVASEDVGMTRQRQKEGKKAAKEESRYSNPLKHFGKAGHDKVEEWGWGERIEQKLADTYQKIGCIAAVECYNLMLGEYSVELTNSRKLVTTTQQIIYNQLVHLMETHDMGTVDAKAGRVVDRYELDDDYDRCILPPTNGRRSGRSPSNRRDSQMQGTRSRRCSKCGEVGHTRHTCRNPRADFDANYEGDVVKVEDLLDGSYVPGH
ncbi:hypothetical protein Cgig2_030431 [Carnegiea gigantea]|uniref:CCHC-type domain-containing protein n=1 Tax=Carnegiea gigantea TaxID=171969 RepID=A0A9Q1KP21_9CARY|nr:hypothetical protein Cgig2_030431 [Carnegiea gigantea]